MCVCVHLCVCVFLRVVTVRVVIWYTFQDIPRPRDIPSQQRVRAALHRFVATSRCPAVMIVSDAGGVEEGGAHRAALERWLSDAVLSHPSVTCLRFVRETRHDVPREATAVTVRRSDLVSIAH